MNFIKVFLISTDPLIERKYVNFIKVFEPECRYAPVMAANRYQNLTEGRVIQDLKSSCYQNLTEGRVIQDLKSSCYQNLTEGRVTQDLKK